MNSSKYSAIVTLLILLTSPPVIAGDFLLGEETKGLTVSVTENTNLNIRVLVQPRLDFGDLNITRDGSRYESESDLYIRRAHLKFNGSLIKNLKYALHLSGDKWEQKGHDDKIQLFYAYLDYTFLKELALRGGKAKLPYSRVSLTPSTSQLLIETPVSTEAAKKVFSSYYQPHLLLHGKFLGGILAYKGACGDGWEGGKTLRAGNTVHKANPLFVGRIEFSPPGWIEKRQSDAHLGQGRHLTLGANYAIQDSIEYREIAFEEDRDLLGFDLSGHWKGITAQFEYNQWRQDFAEPAKRNVEPRGWYLQGGYFIGAIQGRNINLEPAVRYEEYDQDSNAKHKKEKLWTVGLNWYAKGHTLKVGANWVHTTFEKQASGRLVRDDEQDIFQVQAQLYF